MMPVGRETKKLQRKEMTSREVAVELRSKDGSQQEMAGVRSGEGLDDGFLAKRHMSPNVVGPVELASGTNTADRAVGSSHIQNDAVGNAQIANGAVNNAQIGSGQVTDANMFSVSPTKFTRTVNNAELGDLQVNSNKLGANSVQNAKIATSAVNTENYADRSIGGIAISSALNNPAQGSFGLRSLGGTSTSAAPGNHIHSVSFKDLTKAERRRLLKLEDDVRAAGKGDKAFDLLKELVLELFRMAADDPDLDRREREQMLDEGGEKARKYKNRHRIDDFEEEVPMIVPTIPNPPPPPAIEPPLPVVPEILSTHNGALDRLPWALV